jgi:hypothetical protein
MTFGGSAEPYLYGWQVMTRPASQTGLYRVAINYSQSGARLPGRTSGLERIWVFVDIFARGAGAPSRLNSATIELALQPTR